jgi:hypothetical protein
MKKNRISLILDYLKFCSDERKKKNLEDRLQGTFNNSADLWELSELYHNLERIPVPEPHPRLKEGFYEMLEEEKARQQCKEKTIDSPPWMNHLFERKKLVRLAFAIGLFLLGWLAGYKFSPDKEYPAQVNTLLNEVHSTQKMLMLTLLEQPSVTDRLKAISISSKLPATDNKVTDALLNTLNNDPDVNVRLVALDALAQFAHNPKVRIGLIQSISSQNSPIVQVALANTMVLLQEKRSVKELKKLLEKNNLNETVKDELKNSIDKLI